MKRKIEKKTIGVSESKYFIGEMMVCRACQRQERSNIKIESGWTVIEADRVAMYICPKCFNEMASEIRNSK